MIRQWLFLIAFSLCTIGAHSQFSFDTLFNGHPLLKKITSNPDKYHVQIIYTEINYKDGKPVFTDHSFNVRPDNYFYCASLVKLPVSLLGLQKLNELGLSASTIMFTDSTLPCQRKVKHDTTSTNGYPSVEHYIKKMALVSDNEAYSRVYEFLGVDYIHAQLSKAGFPDIRIVTRYDGNCKGKESLITNPVTFLDEDLHILYEQKEQRPSKAYPGPNINMHVGKAYYEGKKRINAPKNFAGSNYMSLSDGHAILEELIFNQNAKFNITEAQRAFLIRYLSYYPRQSSSPVYDPTVYYDSFKKYLFYGDSKNTISDTNLIITNIVGQSYGFLSDCAYFSDHANGIDFLLSAVIYANEDEVINDGKYDYKTVALPYLAELGRQVYKYELRKKQATKK